MEAVGTICAGEWNSSFNGVCSGEADFMAQFFGNCSLPFWGGDETEVKDVGVEETNTASISTFSLGNSVNDSSLMAMDYLNHDASNDSVVSDEKLKRRRRVLGQSQRRKKLRKCVLADENENGSNNASMVLHRQSLRGCCSEDDSNEADGLKSSSSSERRETQNSNGRRRASRGSATDPQSLYARKRRERINEMRTLQSLVPNGTKVDISTMLEEAVQYVKFLQLQIKLLSSDDVGVCSYCLQWDGHRT